MGASPESDVKMSSLHQHALAKQENDNGWGCDGHAVPGTGCGRGMGQTAGVTRYRCVSGCDFDLCGDCIKLPRPDAELFRIGVAPKSDAKVGDRSLYYCSCGRCSPDVCLFGPDVWGDAHRESARLAL